MESYTKYEIIKKFVGSLESEGESNHDERVYKNLCELEDIIIKLVMDLNIESKNSDRHEYSMSKNGKKARSIINEISEYI